MNFIKPFLGNYVITQTYAEHKARAIANGWCWKPEVGCVLFYYPGPDYGTPINTNIIASGDGVVAEAKKDSSPSGGYGNYVKIKHAENFITLYAHLSKISVVTGQNVKQGDIIGLSGYSGNVYPKGVSGAHLHWEMRLNGIPVNPQLYMSSIPIVPTPDKNDNLIINKPAYIKSNVGANLRADMGSALALVYCGTEVMITGSPITLRGLQYYPVTLSGYIAKDDGNGNIILDQPNNISGSLDKIMISAKISHYNPALGGTNCAKFVDGVCVSSLANGEKWEDNMDVSCACPKEYPFGTVFVVNGKDWICKDRGGKIVKESDSIIWLDLLTKTAPVPYGTIVKTEVKLKR